MPDLDGSIKLGVELTPESVSKTADKLRKKVEGIFDASAGKKLDASFKSTQKTMSDLYTKSVELSKQLDEIGKTQVPTENYKELQALLEQDRKAAGNLLEKMERFTELGGSKESKGYIRMRMDMEQLRDSIENTTNEMKTMRTEGTAFMSGTDTAKYQDTLNKLNDVNNRIVIATTRAQDQIAKSDEKAQQAAIKQIEQENKKADAIEKAVARQTAALEKQIREEEKAAEAAQQQSVIDAYYNSTGSEIQPTLMNSYLGEIKERFQEALVAMPDRAREAIANLGSRFVSFGKTAVGALNNVRKRLEDVHKSSKSTTSALGTSLKRLLLMSIGVRSLFALFRKLRSAVIDGIKSIAQFNGGTNSVNSAISQLQSSLNYLKGSWASAFAPIIEFVTPALVKIMDLISQLATRIGMLFAALGGKSTFIQAKKVQTDFAASLDKTGKSADKAAGSLADFDKLTVLTTNDSSGAAGGGGAGDAFEEVPIDSKISDMASKLKDVIDDIFQVFKDAWANKGQLVIDAWKYAFEQLKQLAIDIGKSFMEVWTNGTGLRFVENILTLVAEIGFWIGDIARALDEAWVEAGRGTALIQSFFDMLNAILELIISISQTAREVWNEGFGVQLFADILEIITNINESVANLATRFREAWESNETGKSILQNIADLILVISGTVNGVTQSFREWTEGISFEPLLDSVDRVTGALAPLAGDLGDGIKWFLDNILLPLASWTIEDAVPAFLDLFATALDTLHKIIEAAKPALEWFWDEILQPLAEWTGDLVIDAFKKLNEKLKEFGDWITEHQEGVETFVTILATLGTTALVAVGIFTAVSTVLSIVSTVMGVVSAAGSVLAVVFGAISAPVLVVIGVITALIAIGVALYLHWDTVKEKAKEIWDKITSTIKEKVDAMKEKISEFISTVKEKWNDWLNNIKEKAHNVWSTIHSSITTFIANIREAIVNKILDIKEFWSNVFDSIYQKTSDIFNGILDTIKGIVNSILSVVESMANGIIDGVNGAINAFNSLSVDIPDWVPFVGGNSFSLNIPTLGNVSLPRLAQGAVIPPNREFMAVLGDQKHGTNIEAPVDTIVDAVNIANGDLVAYMQELVELTQQLVEKDVTITSRSVFDAVRTENQNFMRRTGRSGFAY